MTALPRALLAVAVSKSGSTIAAGGKDNSVVLWDVSPLRSAATDKPAKVAVSRVLVPKLDGPILALTFNPADDAIAVAAVKQPEAVIHVKLFGVQDGVEKLDRPVTSPAIGSLVFSPDGARLAATFAKAPPQNVPSLFMWNTADGNQIANLQMPGASIRTFAFSPDGSRVRDGERAGRRHVLERGQSSAPGPDQGPPGTRHERLLRPGRDLARHHRPR